MPRTKRNDPVHESQKAGLVCRRCGCQHFRVVNLSRRAAGVVIRRRECRHCGTRTLTRETQV